MRILSLLFFLTCLGGAAVYVLQVSPAGQAQLAAALDSAGLEVPGLVQPAAEMSTGEGAGDVRRLVVGLDLSASNPMVDDTAYAAKVADYVARMIQPLGFRSQVIVRTFGVFGGQANTFRFDGTVSSRYRPEKMAAEIRTLIASTPELVRRGVWKSQQETNIIGFMLNMAQVVDCDGVPTTYVLLTDGLEDSEFVKLKRPEAQLPDPPRADFAGCAELLMLGVGQGMNSVEQTDRVRAAWSGWADKAGFARFTGLNDW